MPTQIEARLALLERQVAALGSRAAGGEALQPNYLTVTPEGQIGAQFNGGVQLIEGAFPPNTNAALEWLSGTAVRELIYAYANAGAHDLLIESWADGFQTGSDRASLALTSIQNGADGNSIITASVIDSAGGDAAAVIIDSAARSSFLQIGGQSHSTGVTGTLTWPGGSAFSNTATISEAGWGEVNGVFTPAGNIISGGGFFDAGSITAFPGAGGITIQARADGGGSPAAGAGLAYAGLIWD